MSDEECNGCGGRGHLPISEGEHVALEVVRTVFGPGWTGIPCPVCRELSDLALEQVWDCIKAVVAMRAERVEDGDDF